MSRLYRVAAVVPLLFLVGGAGCAWSVGGSREEVLRKPTIGEELIEIKRAHEQGAIDAVEFKKAHDALLAAAEKR